MGVDFLYPPLCGGCEKSGVRWCEDCRKSVASIPEPKCDICGLPQSLAGVCASCQAVKPAYDILQSWAVFEGPIRKALHRIKYRQDLGLGDSLAAEMLDYVNYLRLT